MLLLYLYGIKIHNKYSYIYIFFIISLFIYNLYINHNLNIIYKSIQFISQYFCAIYYLSNKYIYDTFLNYKNIQIYIYICSSLFLCLSIIYSAIEIYYTNIYENSIHNIILNILFNIYGINILLLNFLIFYISFIKILIDLNTIYNNILNNQLNNCIGTIIDIKFVIGSTITNIEYVFNLFTFNGILILSINSIHYDENNNKNYYYYCITFQCILQLIGHSILLLISHYRKQIYNLIHSKIFIQKFINKLNRETFTQVFNRSIEEQEYTNEILLNSIEDNFKSIEWLIYNEILEKNWIELSFMGFNIHNLEFVKKMLLMISITYYIFNYIL
jgi:hypothetical protein